MEIGAISAPSSSSSSSSSSSTSSSTLESEKSQEESNKHEIIILVNSTDINAMPNSQLQPPLLKTSLKSLSTAIINAPVGDPLHASELASKKARRSISDTHMAVTAPTLVVAIPVVVPTLVIPSQLLPPPPLAPRQPAVPSSRTRRLLPIHSKNSDPKECLDRIDDMYQLYYDLEVSE